MPYSSHRHELLEVIQSLTQQLQKADEAVGSLKVQAQAQVATLEEEITTLRNKLADQNKAVEKLVLQLKDTENQLALSRQAQANAERESQQYQSTLALSDRIHASSLEQSRRETQDWKDQSARIETLRVAQGDQIQDLLKALRSFMTNSAPQTHPSTFLPNTSTLRHVGPLISAPLVEVGSTSYVKKEDETKYYDQRHQAGATGQRRRTGQHPTDDGAYPSRGQQQSSKSKKRADSASASSASPTPGGEDDVETEASDIIVSRDRRRGRATKKGRNEEGGDEQDDDDDEMAIGYEERRTSRIQGSPDPRTPGQKAHHTDRHQSRTHGTSTTKTSNRSQVRRPDTTASGNRASVSAKKRKFTQVDDGDDSRGRVRR